MAVDRHERFVRLANKRVSAALKALQLVGNLGNQSNYSYGKEEAAKILKALQSELDQVKAAFSPADGKEKRGGFSL
jgi:hypothetical protein